MSTDRNATEKAAEPCSGELPWAKWYPRQLLGDITAYGLEFADVGLLYVLLALQDANSGLPVPLPEIRKKVPRKVSRRSLELVIERYFPVAPTGDRRRNEEFHRERTQAADTHRKKVEAGRKGGTTKWARLRDPIAAEQLDSTATSTVTSSATASATSNQKESQNQSQSPPSSVGPAAGPGNAARLLEALPTPADRVAVQQFLERCPESDRSGWAQRLSAYLEGLDFPAGMCPTPAHLATACRDYSATPPNPIHFRAFVMRVIKGTPERRALGKSRATEDPTARQISDGLRWAAQGA